MFRPVLAVTQSAVSASVIASESVAIPLAFELLAVVVAAATGALTARENKLDLVGAIGLAVLVSLGGGLIRDVILRRRATSTSSASRSPCPSPSQRPRRCSRSPLWSKNPTASWRYSTSSPSVCSPSWAQIRRCSTAIPPSPAS
ncbi:MAG: TRIC cation channel family protein [Collinsella sp.]